MGTNFYYHYNRCEHCNREDVLHVGKRSMGWSFGFRAYRDRIGIPDIVSITDWERFFKTHPGYLIDEYQAPVENPLQFLADLERPTKSQQEDEDSLDRRGRWAGPPDPTYEWRDSQGFRFHDGEFC